MPHSSGSFLFFFSSLTNYIVIIVITSDGTNNGANSQSMEQDEATGSQAVFSEAQMKAIAGVVGGLLQQALKEAKKDDDSQDASANQASGSQGSNSQGVCSG